MSKIKWWFLMANVVYLNFVSKLKLSKMQQLCTICSLTKLPSTSLS